MGFKTFSRFYRIELCTGIVSIYNYKYVYKYGFGFNYKNSWCYNRNIKEQIIYLCEYIRPAFDIK